MMDGPLQLIINIGAVAVAFSALVGVPLAIVKLWPVIKRFVALGATLERLPETLRHQDETLANQNTVLDGIVESVNKAVQQVQNSHVTNLRDDVDEVIGKVDSLHEKLDEHLKASLTPPTTTINVTGSST